LTRTLNLFEAATRRSRLIKQGDLTQVVVDGGGAFVVFTQDFAQVQKWAQSKAASQNLMTDRGRVFEQFSVLISRPGSQAATRGNSKQLESLARAMKQGGFDLGEWALPPEMKNVGRPDPDALSPKKPAPESESGGEPNSDSDQDAPPKAAAD